MLPLSVDRHARGADVRRSRCSATTTATASVAHADRRHLAQAASSRRSAGGAPVAVNLVWLLAHTDGQGQDQQLTAARLQRYRGATAVATLFIASVARMITLRAASLVVQRHLELLAPRVRDAVLRVDHAPAARVERVLDALHG